MERDNRKLLEKMSHIMQTRGHVDNHNDYEQKRYAFISSQVLIRCSLNRDKRQRELLEISQQNQAILERIQARGANYSHEEMVCAASLCLLLTT